MCLDFPDLTVSALSWVSDFLSFWPSLMVSWLRKWKWHFCSVPKAIPKFLWASSSIRHSEGPPQHGSHGFGEHWSCFVLCPGVTLRSALVWEKNCMVPLGTSQSILESSGSHATVTALISGPSLLTFSHKKMPGWTCRTRAPSNPWNTVGFPGGTFDRMFL